MLSLSDDNRSDVIEAFSSTSRYLDDLLNIDNNFFECMVNRIYPSEFRLNNANVSDTETSFLAHLSHRLRVSYCHWPMSVVRRASSVVRRQQLL